MRRKAKSKSFDQLDKELEDWAAKIIQQAKGLGGICIKKPAGPIHPAGRHNPLTKLHRDK
mgnify:CR=1 FL=1|tara:strand:+ start:1161 stop:1340 length:180 start_codon:yes stop_codon:yes gene_type:complete